MNHAWWQFSNQKPFTFMMARIRSFSKTAATSLAAALPAAALLVLMKAILRPSSSSASRYSSSTYIMSAAVQYDSHTQAAVCVSGRLPCCFGALGAGASAAHMLQGRTLQLSTHSTSTSTSSC